eukprot:TRINITY_DN64939_c0_g1_i1.p1 TRINITY_DN64939_c0_g1~~TRINITY_DN64939_c0_g1_i1.p1  ORF type:complete len:701 (-),score=144.82 TRINITY_DN64939_c0_g1_i1:82-2148(-)
MASAALILSTTTLALAAGGLSDVDGGAADSDGSQCRKKDVDPHGTWSGSRAFGGELTLTCNRGFAVNGQSSVTVTCSSNGRWSSDPWCVNIDDCNSLLYSCGPAGLCVDHVGYAECLCEEGSVMQRTADEDACYFPGQGDWDQCGEKNCGPHGICVDFAQFANVFNNKASSFHCSCRNGYVYDGETCTNRDCGTLVDPYGVWTGSSTYLGEYTLQCADGAYVDGGSEQATTISCPETGFWRYRPRCLSAAEEEREAEMLAARFWFNVGGSFTCIVIAALAAGLTIGLVSIEPQEMKILMKTRPEDCASPAERRHLAKQQRAAARILPVLKDQHLLLVTLLLMNATAGEALPTFLDGIVSPLTAVLLSVSFVVVCCEILPSAIFTGPMQLPLAAMLVPLVKVLLVALFFIAKPIAIMLDQMLPHQGQYYSRHALRAVMRLHGAPEDENNLRHSSRSPCSSDVRAGGLGAGSGSGVLEVLEEGVPLVGPSDDEEGSRAEDAPPLEALEVELCLAALDLGEVRVTESSCFWPLHVTGGRDGSDGVHGFHAAAADESCSAVAAEALRLRADVVLVVASRDALARWPRRELPATSVLVPLRTADIAALPSASGAASLHAVLPELSPHSACVRASAAVADALGFLAQAGTPCGLALVRGLSGQVVGVFDGEAALAGLLSQATCCPRTGSSGAED